MILDTDLIDLKGLLAALATIYNFCSEYIYPLALVTIGAGCWEIVRRTETA